MIIFFLLNVEQWDQNMWPKTNEEVKFNVFENICMAYFVLIDLIVFVFDYYAQTNYRMRVI